MADRISPVGPSPTSTSAPNTWEGIADAWEHDPARQAEYKQVLPTLIQLGIRSAGSSTSGDDGDIKAPSTPQSNLPGSNRTSTDTTPDETTASDDTTDETPPSDDTADETTPSDKDTDNVDSEDDSEDDAPSDTSSTARGSGGDSIPSEFSQTAPPAGKSISKAEADKIGLQVMSGLIRDFGFTPEQAAGIVGNLYHESGGSSDPAGLNPHLNEHGSNPGGYGNAPADPKDPAAAWRIDFGPPNDSVLGYGWAQWTGERKTEFLEWAKSHNLDPGSPAANYGFLAHELKNKEAATVPAVKATKTPKEAADAFLTKFERATIPIAQKRQEFADHFLELWNSKGGKKS